MSTQDHQEESFDFKLYRYDPSLPAAIVTVIVFAILTAGHVWRLWRARAYYFVVFTIGGLCQVIGYAGRIVSHFDKEALPGFIVQSILILVAPALFAASIYMILGRLIRAVHAESYSIVRPRWVTRIFVAGDVVSFLMQAGGGGIQSSGTLEMYKTGEKVIIGGLFVQIFVFGFFVITSCLFHYRLVQKPTEESRRGRVAWRRHLMVLYGTSALILVRSIFRVIEYLQGNGGYLISYEIFLYIFDAVLMAAAMAVFLVWYVDDLQAAGPGRSEEEGYNERLNSSDGMLEELPRSRQKGHK